MTKYLVLLLVIVIILVIGASGLKIPMKNDFSKIINISNIKKTVSVVVISSILNISPMLPGFADDVPQTTTKVMTDSNEIPIVPLFTKRTSDLIPYSDIGRGFKILRPFGWNEFDGVGGTYLKKFSSLVECMDFIEINPLEILNNISFL